MKYTSILLSLLLTALTSCEIHIGETASGSDSTKVDSVKVDTIKADSIDYVDERTEVIDTPKVDSLKKKGVQSLYTSKCVAYKSWRIS